MISTAFEYQRSQEQLEHLEKWLARLRSDPDPGKDGLVKAGIRKLIARFHEEMAVYEGTLDSQRAVTLELEEVAS